jgi:NADPH:quinone reductase-like Zn-dependent oxidoreductase
MIAFDTYMTDLGYRVPKYPLVLGFNASGTVKTVGPDVTGLAVDDRVSQSKLEDLLTLYLSPW